MENLLSKYRHVIQTSDFIKFSGRVSKLIGLTIEANGPAVEIGEVCEIYPLKSKKFIRAEVIGFRDNVVVLMPFGEMSGIGPGSKVIATGSYLSVEVGDGLLGRVLDGLGRPIDAFKPPILHKRYEVDNMPPNPLTRDKIESVLPLGITAIDALLTCGRGQRVGIFAGSGVGKSTLLGMIAKNSKADVNVIALIGERGREVREFLENDLGEEGLKKSVLIVATSDQPALVRVKGAMLATAVAEYFRDCGKNVVLMMDSLTRFSMAQREIGLAVGEPPVTKGYTPSVFAVLPKLLERSGNSDKGSITGLYTVLVDGDDMNEPIADAVRGILDGHIVLSRKLASKGYYPAIDVLESVSRVMPNVVDQKHVEIARRIKELMAVHAEAEDLIVIGAYVKGTDKRIDEAILKIDAIRNFLTQTTKEHFTYEETVDKMFDLLND